MGHDKRGSSSDIYDVLKRIWAKFLCTQPTEPAQPPQAKPYAAVLFFFSFFFFFFFWTNTIFNIRAIFMSV